jgi:hypothetical protein
MVLKVQCAAAWMDDGQDVAISGKPLVFIVDIYSVILICSGFFAVTRLNNLISASSGIVKVQNVHFRPTLFFPTEVASRGWPFSVSEDAFASQQLSTLARWTRSTF